MNEISEIVRTLLLLLPVGGGVGYLFYRGIRHTMRSVVTEEKPTIQDPSTEIERIKAKDRADARELYERITRDKLDVIKTAIAMGADKSELRELDARLENLIGSEKLHAMINEQGSGTPPLNDEMLDVDLTLEIERLSENKAKGTE